VRRLDAAFFLCLELGGLCSVSPKRKRSRRKEKKACRLPKNSAVWSAGEQ
jgi:hypothetical protein